MKEYPFKSRDRPAGTERSRAWQAYLYAPHRRKFPFLHIRFSTDREPGVTLRSAERVGSPQRSVKIAKSNYCRHSI